MKTYRKLTKEEIDCLKRQFCKADDWQHVEVAKASRRNMYARPVFQDKCALGCSMTNLL